MAGSWQVEDIDRGGVIDMSMVTLQFEAGSRISGFTGCNRYSATLETTGGSFSVSGVSMTRRACVPALMNQERRFLAALDDISHHEMESDTWLVLRDGAGRQRLRLIRMVPRPEPPEPVPDRSLTQTTTFQCAAAGAVGIRFLGPETIEVSAEGRAAILQRSRSASGARYRGESMQFWNKGDEALLTLDGQEYHCARESL